MMDSKERKRSIYSSDADDIYRLDYNDQTFGS